MHRHQTHLNHLEWEFRGCAAGPASREPSYHVLESPTGEVTGYCAQRKTLGPVLTIGTFGTSMLRATTDPKEVATIRLDRCSLNFFSAMRMAFRHM